MNWKYFIGIDISKAILDVCVLNGKEKNRSFEIENKPTGLAAFWKVLAKQIPDLSKKMRFSVWNIQESITNMF